MKAVKVRTSHDFDRAVASPSEGRYIVGLVSTYDGTIHVVGEYTARWAAEKHVADLRKYENWNDLRILERGVDVDVIYRVKNAQCSVCLRYHPGGSC